MQVRGIGKGEKGYGHQVYVNGEWHNADAAPVIREADAGHMKSMAMGCPNEVEQRRRLEMFAKEGIRGVRYHPETAQLMFKGGLSKQKKLAAMHGLEVS